MDDYYSSDDFPVTDLLHEACTEINVEFEPPECDDLCAQDQGSGDQEIAVSEFTKTEDRPSIINIELPSGDTNISCETQQNDEPTYEKKQRKFLYPTTSYTKNSKFQMKCEECKLTFHRSYVYCNHMIVTHNMSFPKCAMCDKYFHNPRLLKRHMCRHLRAKKHKSIVTDFLCDVCGKHFSKYRSFRSHQITHHNSTGEFKCDTCGKMFRGKYRFLIHRNSHSSCKEFMCEMCGMQFKSRTTFQRHRGKHLGTDTKKKQCPICDKRFENSSRLSIHLLSHNGAKPHTCELCNRGFSVLQNLKRHIRWHTGEKPFACDLCKKRFTRKTGLKEHHCGLKKPKLECNVCGKLFKFKGTLQRHLINVHTDGKVKMKLVTCKICGRTLTHPSNMKRHLLAHSNERRFVCEVCKKRFKTKYEFEIHTRRHTGEKPYKCQFCEMSFVDSGEKGRHEKKHLLHGGGTRKKVNK